MATIAERNIIFKIQADTANARKGVEKISKDVTGLNGIVRQATANFASLAAFDVAGRITGGLKSIADQSIRLAINSEQTNVAFETFLGSAQKAAEVVAQLKQFSALTPFEPEQVLQAGKALLAFGVAAEDLEPTLKAVGDLSAGTGKDFNELAVIFGKAKTQGVLFAEDINQLTESGIPVIQEFAKQLGVSEGAVKKLASEGKISFSNLEQAFQDLTSEGGRFFDLTAKQSQTVGGRISTLVGNFNSLLESIGTGLLPTFGRLVDLFSILTREVKNYTDVKLSDQIENERIELNSLVLSITDVNVGEEERGKLIDQLNKKFPDFLANIDQENISNATLATRLAEVNTQLVNQIILQRQIESIKEQAARVADAQQEAIRQESFVTQDLVKANDLLNNSLDFTNKTQEERIRLTILALAKTAEFREGGNVSNLPVNEAARIIKRLKEDLGALNNAESRATKANEVLTDLQKERIRLEAEFGIEIKATTEETNTNTKAVKDLTKAEEKLAAARKKREEGLENDAFLENAKRTVEFRKQQAEDAKEEEKRGKEQIKAADELAKKRKEAGEAEQQRAKEFIDNLQDIKFAGDIAAAEFDEQQEAQIQSLDEIIAKEDELQAKRQANAQKAIETTIKTTNAVLDIAKDALDIEIGLLDARIDAQQERISAAVKVAERGNAELLQSEEDRLIALTNAREKAAERQAQIAQIQAAANQLVAVSQGVVAVTKAFAEGNIFTGIATSAALAIQVAAIIASINNSANSVQGFADGTEFVQGPGGSRTDSINARLSRGERVVPAHINSKYYDALNEFQYATPKADIMNDLLKGGGRGSTTDMSVVEGQLMQMNERLDSLEMNVSLDQDGFSASLQKFQTKQTRKNKLL